MLNELNQELRANGFLWGWGESIPYHWKRTRKYQELKQQWSQLAEFSARQTDINMCASCNRKTCTVEAAIASPGFMFSAVQSSPVPEMLIEQVPQISNEQAAVLKSLLSSMNFAYTVPAIRGVQGGQPFYTATVPLAVVAELFKAK